MSYDEKDEHGNFKPVVGSITQLTGPATNGLGQPFTIKDSGKRQELSNGMVRDVTEGKIDYTLIRDGVLFKRWAEHLTKGANKYGKRNWLKGNTSVELLRFKESAARHFEEWMAGNRDEDHASATLFNLDGYERLWAQGVREE